MNGSKNGAMKIAPLLLWNGKAGLERYSWRLLAADDEPRHGDDPGDEQTNIFVDTEFERGHETDDRPQSGNDRDMPRNRRHEPEQHAESEDGHRAR